MLGRWVLRTSCPCADAPHLSAVTQALVANEGMLAFEPGSDVQLKTGTTMPTYLLHRRMLLNEAGTPRQRGSPSYVGADGALGAEGPPLSRPCSPTDALPLPPPRAAGPPTDPRKSAAKKRRTLAPMVTLSNVMDGAMTDGPECVCSV